MKPWLVLLLIIFVIGAVAGAGYLGSQTAAGAENDLPPTPVTVAVTRGDVQQTVTAPGQLIGTREELVGFKVGGQLAEINIHPGSVVRAGDALAQLDPETFQERLDQAQLELAQAEREQAHQLASARLDLQIAEARLQQAQADLSSVTAVQAELKAAQTELEQLLAGPDENEITVAAAELRQSEVTLKQAQWAYDQVAYSSDAGAKPEARELEKTTLDYEAKLAAYRLASQGPTEANIATARAKVEQAQAEVDATLAEQEAGRQEVAILEAELEQAHLTIARLQEGVDPLLLQAVKEAEKELAQTALIAPFDGVVLDVLAQPGETVTPETELLLLADPAAVEVRVKVIEEDLPLVQVGQPVDLFFDAQSETAIQARVTRIVPQRIANEDRPLYYVYINLPKLPEGVVAGMTADASIIVAERPAALRLPRALVRANSQGEAQVKVWAGGQIADREVQVGLRGDVYVEIVAGLQEGEQVLGE